MKHSLKTLLMTSVLTLPSTYGADLPLTQQAATHADPSKEIQHCHQILPEVKQNYDKLCFHCLQNIIYKKDKLAPEDYKEVNEICDSIEKLIMNSIAFDYSMDLLDTANHLLKYGTTFQDIAARFALMLLSPKVKFYDSCVDDAAEILIKLGLKYTKSVTALFNLFKLQKNVRWIYLERAGWWFKALGEEDPQSILDHYKTASELFMRMLEPESNDGVYDDGKKKRLISSVIHGIESLPSYTNLATPLYKQYLFIENNGTRINITPEELVTLSENISLRDTATSKKLLERSADPKIGASPDDMVRASRMLKRYYSDKGTAKKLLEQAVDMNNKPQKSTLINVARDFIEMREPSTIDSAINLLYRVIDPRKDSQIPHPKHIDLREIVKIILTLNATYHHHIAILFDKFLSVDNNDETPSDIFGVLETLHDFGADYDRIRLKLLMRIQNNRELVISKDILKAASKGKRYGPAFNELRLDFCKRFLDPNLNATNEEYTLAAENLKELGSEHYESVAKLIVRSANPMIESNLKAKTQHINSAIAKLKSLNNYSHMAIPLFEHYLAPNLNLSPEELRNAAIRLSKFEGENHALIIKLIEQSFDKRNGAEPQDLLLATETLRKLGQTFQKESDNYRLYITMAVTLHQKYFTDYLN